MKRILLFITLAALLTAQTLYMLNLVDQVRHLEEAKNSCEFTLTSAMTGP